MRRSAIINIMITSSGGSNKRDNNDIVNKRERRGVKECRVIFATGAVT